MNKVGCPTCGGLFSNRVKFLDHVRRRNTGKLQFPCKTCGKAFSVERLMRDHMRSHVNLYQVSSKCYFPNNGLLFQCPACDMTCSTPSILATHMRYRHTTERPHACQVNFPWFQLAIKCLPLQFCEYRGKTKADMRSHARIHYTEVCRRRKKYQKFRSNNHSSPILNKRIF